MLVEHPFSHPGDGELHCPALCAFEWEPTQIGSRLRGVETPIGFVWGERDLCGAADTARTFAGHFDDAHLEIIPGAGDAPWLDDIDRSVAVTREFPSL